MTRITAFSGIEKGGRFSTIALTCGKSCTLDEIYEMAEFISGESRAVLDAVSAFHLGYEGAVRMGKNLVYTDLFLNRDGADVDYAAEAEKLRAALAVLREAKPTEFLAYYCAAFTAALRRCEILEKLRPACLAKDRKTLADIADRQIPALKTADDGLYRAWMQPWQTTYKVFGSEIFAYRFGGMEKRLDEQAERIGRYLSDGTPIPELEEERIRGVQSTWRCFEDFTVLSFQKEPERKCVRVLSVKSAPPVRTVRFFQNSTVIPS